MTTSTSNEDGIAASRAPVPTEPEDRLARLEAWLVDPDDPPPAYKVPAVRLAIAGIRAEIDAGITPTKYVPHERLKGGRG